jgi:hypothetical protein
VVDRVGGWAVLLAGLICRISKNLKISSRIQIHHSTRSSKRSNPTSQWQTYPLLGELASPLILGVPQEFDDAALIRGKTGDLADNVADKGSAAGGTALGAADTVLGGVEGGGFLLPPY